MIYSLDNLLVFIATLFQPMLDKSTLSDTAATSRNSTKLLGDAPV
jgi:hypothetical protein